MEMPEEGMKKPSVLKSANPVLYKELSVRAKEMRANPTPAEKVLWEKLKNKQLGIKFRQQHIVNKFIVDFCSIEKALIIEVDGEIHDNQKEADSQRSEILKNEGYSVIRFSNDEIINNIDNVISIIKSKTEKSPLGDLGAYKDIPEYCYSAHIDEIRKKDYSLVPSKYIEFVNRDENIDFDEKMKILQTEFADLLKAEESSRNELLSVFRELGYEIKL